MKTRQCRICSDPLKEWNKIICSFCEEDWGQESEEDLRLYIKQSNDRTRMRKSRQRERERISV